MKNSRLNKLIKISLLSVIAFLLMFLEFGVAIFPDFLKLDISDLPALVGAFALGPVAGIAIEFVKNILHLIIKGTTTAGIGEAANFMVGSTLVFVSALVYKYKKTRLGASVGLLLGVVAMSIVAAIMNYYVLIPAYDKLLHFPVAAIVGMGSKINHNIKDLFTLILWSIIPFNLLKGVVVSVLTLGVYKSVSPVIHSESTRLSSKKTEEM